MNTVTCDSCEEAVDNPIHVAFIDDDGEDAEHDFCSFACLAAWAMDAAVEHEGDVK